MQQSFKSHVLSLVETIIDMGNSFVYQSNELFALHTGNVVDESVVETVRIIEQVGKQQFTRYHKSVLIDRTHSIHKSITKNRLSLFKSPKTYKAI